MVENIQVKQEEKTSSIYVGTCPYCNRKFEQNYESQLIHNLKVHILNCKLNPDVEDVEDVKDGKA